MMFLAILITPIPTQQRATHSAQARENRIPDEPTDACAQKRASATIPRLHTALALTPVVSMP